MVQSFLTCGTPFYFYLAFSWLSMMTVFDLSGLVMMCMLVIQYYQCFHFQNHCCLFFFDIRILITPLVYSNSSSVRLYLRLLLGGFVFCLHYLLSYGSWIYNYLCNTNVVSSNPTQARCRPDYSIQHYVSSLSVTCGRSVVLSGFLHQ